MMRLHRYLPSLTIALALAMPVLNRPAFGQDQPAPADAGAATDTPTTTPTPAPTASDTGTPAHPQDAAPADPALVQTVDDFWHFAKIGNYDQAIAEANKILSASADPIQVLVTFRKVAADHKDELTERLLGWQRVEKMKETSEKLLDLIKKAELALREDSKFIDENIQRLIVSERGFALGLANLKQSGELAVPQMVAYLQDPSKKQYQFAVLRALRSMGRSSLNPLLAATEMKDKETLALVITTLGDLGYNAAVPYLARLATAQDSSAGVKDAAALTLIRMNAGDPKNLNVGQLFFDLAEKFYYRNTVLDPAGATGLVWYWDDKAGLRSRTVPAEIFNEVMAMRSCEYVLKLDPSRPDAVSLWLASNYRREAELPAGATDPTRAEGQPDAHYYGVVAGSKYLSATLARALRDRNAAVAIRAIRSLQEIVGESNFLSGEDKKPLLQALDYPERIVRFEAAFAIAAALPQKPFPMQERVVPILAEALAQTGKPGILVMGANQNQLNGLLEAARKADYNAAGGFTTDTCLASADNLPSIDIILMPEDLEKNEMNRFFAGINENPRLQRASRLIITKSATSPFAAVAADDPLVNITQSTDPAQLAIAFDAARKRGSSMPLDDKQATAFALRSADFMSRLAISRGQVLDLAGAMPALLASLDDSRPEIVKAAGNVLALMNYRDAQTGLAAKALGEKTSEELKVSLFKNLATSAKFFGNQIEQTQVEELQKVAEGAKDLAVRSAAAEAHGALNLPAEQVKTLIVNQSKI